MTPREKYISFLLDSLSEGLEEVHGEARIIMATVVSVGNAVSFDSYSDMDYEGFGSGDGEDVLQVGGVTLLGGLLRPVGQGSGKIVGESMTLMEAYLFYDVLLVKC